LFLSSFWLVVEFVVKTGFHDKVANRRASGLLARRGRFEVGRNGRGLWLLLCIFARGLTLENRELEAELKQKRCTFSVRVPIRHIPTICARKANAAFWIRAEGMKRKKSDSPRALRLR